MNHKTTLGHLAALLTAAVWGTTFISTKVLLAVFQPAEILFIRFILGFAALCIAAPRRLHTTGWRQEVSFALAGLSGICLYYLLENIALTFTLASNVGGHHLHCVVLHRVAGPLFPPHRSAAPVLFLWFCGRHGRHPAHQLQRQSAGA